MKVVGLLSGGKDSVYNLLHCIINNHEPVAVASVGPPENKDELDSYMYQTVGHSGLVTLAKALQLPLFKRTITGQAIHVGGDYGDRKAAVAGGTIGDETEDLYELLRTVKEAMPEIQGVAVGAILSNYQRVRVEHVCSRLGLTPIAFLWERNQEELLQEMVKAGMNSVLVKVAGAGLEISHLGKSLAEMQPTLQRLNAKFQTHVCGEGGEYETFTLDCPIFKQRVVLEKVTTVISDPSPWSTVAHLHLDELSLADKQDGRPADVETFEETRARLLALDLVVVPDLFDRRGKRAMRTASDAYENVNEKALEQTSHPTGVSNTLAGLNNSAAVTNRIGEWLHISEAMARQDGLEVEDEVRACFTELESALSVHGATLLHLSHLNVYLSSTSMSLFPRINVVYSSYFGASPPTRACVSVLLPPNRRIKLAGIAHIPAASTSRTCLHVQSMSYWAPANIGPYSQAITAGQERTFIAGQIPLVPRSLTLEGFEESDRQMFPRQVALSLQHVRRVKRAATEGRWKGWSEGGICWIRMPSSWKSEEDSCLSEWRRRVRCVTESWEAFERDDLLEDDSHGESDDDNDNDGEGRPAPLLCVQAEDLPRAASVEWQLTWATGLQVNGPRQEDDSDDENGLSEKAGVETYMRDLMGSITRQCSKTERTAKTVVAVVSFSSADEIARQHFPGMGPIQAIQGFHMPHVTNSQICQAASIAFGLPEQGLPALSTIGARRLAVSDRDDVELAFVITASVLEQ